MRVKLLRVLMAFLTLMLLAPSHAFAQQRPLTPDDLFRLEEVGAVVVSPDGNWVAYVLKRAKSTAKNFKQDFLAGNDRADIWLVPTRGGKSENLTHGAVDGSGYWAPLWSPDGERLALLSTKSGNVRLWVWERSSGKLRALTDLGVDTFGWGPPFIWLSNEELLCPVLPDGERPSQMMLEMQAAVTAMKEWPKTWRGEGVTASVLDSGINEPMQKRPQSSLLLINLAKGSKTILSGLRPRGIHPAPSKRLIAIINEVDVLRPRPNELLAHGEKGVYQVLIIQSQGNVVSSALRGVQDVRRRSLRWSPNGQELAIIGNAPEGPVSSPQVFRCSVVDGLCRAVTNPDLALQPAMIWSGTNQLIVRAQPKATSGQPGKTNQWDWWVIEGNQVARNLTAGLKSSPTQLIAGAGGRSFVGLSDGHLWQIHLDGSAPRDLTESAVQRFSSIAWPQLDTAEPGTAHQLILASSNGSMEDLYRIDLSSGEIVPLKQPMKTVKLLDYEPHRQVAVLQADDRSGTYLWLSPVTSETITTVVETNTFLREIAEGQSREIKYRGLDGSDLEAWVLLPPDYQQGKRYPLVTWVYPGSIAGETPEPLTWLNFSQVFNMQLLAAHGYAVLFPSMPVKHDASDPYMDLTIGVLPALDKLIEMGIADPMRLGVMGQSWGGYSTYGLITQTNRFQVAVASAAASDLVSDYGIFDARFRYTSFPHENLSSMSYLETSSLVRMGNPPWKDWARYLRNSPLFYVDRVETPLMIIHGDMDYVPIQQAEEFFSALYRQNKRARFVRYWGEGHFPSSPANIRDLWYRVFAWFDEYLDIARDSSGSLIFDGDRVKSRGGAPATKPSAEHKPN
jgi:dipeptidyl aminopeptidase/acylaminoacyl peptidase